MFVNLSNPSIRIKLIGTFLIVALLGAITGFVGFYNIKQVGKDGVTVGEKLAPLSDAAMEIKLTAANAHLIFEEVMAGDAGEDVKEVWNLLDETLFYCNAILSGGKNDEGTFLPSTDPAVLAKMALVKSSVENFIKSAHSRYDNRATAAGSGSDADQKFDSSYEEIIKALDTILSRHQSDLGRMASVVAAGKAKFYLADRHLFFEELLSGDHSVKFENILSGIASARKEVEFMDGKVEKADIPALLASIDTLTASAKTRYQNNAKKSASAQEVEAAFDKEYDAFIALADEAEELIHDDMDLGMESLKERISRTGRTLVAIIIAAVLTALAIGFILSRSVTTAFGKCLDLSSRITEGKLTGSIDLRTLPGDETGALASELNTMSSNLKQMVSSIQSGVHRLKDSTTTLSKASNQIEDKSAQTTERSGSVAAASEEMNVSMTNVVTSTEQVTANIQMVASAAEEMIATIQEIASNTSQGNEITQNAVGRARDVSERVNALDRAAQEINKVTETISDISEQTNLLALNATIEAARAGEAGKGFAVVAGEIKALAQQTADATTDINTKITGIQTNISDSVAVIESIVSIIGDINEIVTTVATAVEEQSATSQEISLNINQAALGVQEVNDNMNQINQVSAQVSRDVSLVNQMAEETMADCSHIKTSSNDLESLSRDLDKLVSKFKV